MADNGTLGRVRTMYVKGTSERVKKLGDEVAAVLKKPKGQVSKDELNKALDSTDKLSRAGPPLNNVEELNRLSLHQALIERGSSEGLMTPQEIMGRKDTMRVAIGAPGGGGSGGRMPSRNGGTGPMLPKTGAASGQKPLPAGGSGVAVQKKLPPLRQEYVDKIEKLKAKRVAMEKEGKSDETIARELHAERRAVGEEYKALTPPEKLNEIYDRNIQKYGDKLGPRVDWLRNQGKSWSQISESATRTGGKDLGF